MKSPVIQQFLHNESMKKLPLIEQKKIRRKVNEIAFKEEMEHYEEIAKVKRGVLCIVCAKPTQLELRHICQHLQ